MEIYSKYKPWVSEIFTTNVSTRYCGTVRGPHVEKLNS